MIIPTNPVLLAADLISKNPMMILDLAHVHFRHYWKGNRTKIRSYFDQLLGFVKTLAPSHVFHLRPIYDESNFHDVIVYQLYEE